MQISKRITLDPVAPLEGVQISLSVLASVSVSTINPTITTDTPDSVGPDSRAGDEAALEDLYTSTNGSSWSNNTGWASSGMSLDGNIYGVTTETIGGELRVTELNLKDNNLTGNINNASFGNLKKMNYLNIFFNKISGNLPDSLGNCISLVYGYFNMSNDVLGKDNDPHVEATTGGEDIHAGKQPTAVNDGSEWNTFNGAIPTSIGQLSSLEWFMADWQYFTSFPDEITNCTNLKGLHLTANQGFSLQSLPTNFINLSNLQYLSMSPYDHNDPWLQGDWPTGSENLVSLKAVRIQGQDLGPMPDWSGGSSLITLVYDRNEMTGSMPAWILDGTHPNMNAVLCSFPADGVGWTGQIPPIGNINLRTLNIYGHSLSGSIPPSLWTNAPGIIVTSWTSNEFTSLGTDDLTNISQIRNLRYQNNQVSGILPPIDTTNTDFTRCYIQGNDYVFADLIPHFDDYVATVVNQNGGTFTYSPQNNFGSSSVYTLNAGNSITIDDFDTVVTHANNTYQWQKDGVNISGATSKNLSLSNVQSSDSGTYRLIVTNSNVPNLTLQSRDIILDVQ